MPLDPYAFRHQFPALSRTLEGRPVAYLDAPGGTQVPQQVIDAMAAYLSAGGSNLGGSFAASRASEEVVAYARAALADFLGGRPEEVVFGPNMTTLTFAMSRTLARTWQRGDRVVVTRLDHDANVTPWVVAAEERGVEVVFADLDREQCLVDLDHLESLLTPRTRLVAITKASNAFGSVVDVARVAAAAHREKALVYVDAVHFAPHGLMDVVGWDADFVVCSGYKIFGPHTGILWGRRELLEELPAYRVRPAPSDPPGKFETGTANFEGLAGLAAAVDYLAGICGGEGGRRPRLVASYQEMEAYERSLAARFLAGVESLPRLRVYGVSQPDGPRVPTFAVEVEGRRADEVAAELGRRGLFVWAGHYYAVEPMARLGLLERGGLVRIGFVHTTTAEEVDRVLESLSSASPA